MSDKSRGPLAWMAGHNVGSNLIMLMILAGGIISLGYIRQEVFPEFEIDMVSVTVEYPGASPSDVEKSIIRAIENSVSGIDGITEVKSTAVEGGGQVTMEVVGGRKPQDVAQDVKSAVDRIVTFPQEIERPTVSVVSRRRPVLGLVLYGDVDMKVLHHLAELYRDELINHPGITVVEIEGIPPLEISVEISQNELRKYKLSIDDVAARIKSFSKDVPSGSIKTAKGEILVRVNERKDFGTQLADIPIIDSGNGTSVLLRHIAIISDNFRETDEYSRMNGHAAVKLEVFREGEQTPVGVAAAVKEVIEKMSSSLPEGVNTSIVRNRSVTYRQRINLILKNGFMGLVLVLLLLGLFLEARLAFWVAMGIPVSFMGAFIIMPILGISINMMSTFACIIALGIVVDDAIVVGEQVYSYRQSGMAWGKSAIKGVRDVAMPVTFSVLTNIITFIPIYLIPGRMGKIFNVIPVVVIIVFLISLFESLFILPSHLGHRDMSKVNPIMAFFEKFQQKFSRGFSVWVKVVYGSFLKFTLKARYVMVSLAVGLLMMSLAYSSSGRMGFHLFPKIESDFSEGTLVLPFGTPVEKTEKVLRKMLSAAQKVKSQLSDPGVVRSITMDVGRGGGHNGRIRVNLAPPSKRKGIVTTEEFTRKWRKLTGEVPGVEYLRFASDTGGPGGRGRPLTMELSHRDLTVLKKAAAELSALISQYPQTKDLDDGFEEGKVQYNITMKKTGTFLGLNASTIGKQLRNSFYGSEVLRQIRGRNELKIMVRLPRKDREKTATLENFMVKLPAGGFIPLVQVADISYSRSFTTIVRRNGRRVVQVSADVQPRAKAEEILKDLTEKVMPGFLSRYQGLRYSVEGHRADMRESLNSLKTTFSIALMGIYLLLAILFRSYIQPFIVMISIPFGIIGAFLGHYIMGYTLSLPSIFGIVALSGVVVNDSLVMIDFANRQLKKGKKHIDAVHDAAVSRFRAIFLTTVTTFGGLFPMIFETDRSARFLIPMGLSLGFGLVFATFITLVIVPSLYVAASDVTNIYRKIRSLLD
ncbi:MAG: efflux RND transporter permease subunit [Deltaproteobacteria bacterium]|nr:efflux RND transporter permease subunit [Deltaproteobacteria bacterium]